MVKLLAQLQRLAIAPSQLGNSQLNLHPDQQHYLLRVLRLKSGDRFIAMDGQGHWWLSELNSSPDTATILESLSIQNELPVSVTLLIALPKGNGMDEVVRQTTELGVAQIVPVLSDRTVLNPSPQKIERWRRIAQEAAEQSERQVIPAIAEPISWATALETLSDVEATQFICTARGHRVSLLQRLHDSQPTQLSSMIVATGPEGGWTMDEVEQATAKGFQPISLGCRILRAVTAPVVAMSLIASVVEMMSDS